MRKIILFCLCGLFSCTLTGCHTKEGVFVPFVGTCYDYSYLNSLEGGKIGEPLNKVTIKDETAAIKLYGSVEAAETFESYFSDNIKAGKELDNWWNSPIKTLRSDKDIIRTIRHGFRNTRQDKTKIIRWVSKRYGTPRNFFNKYSLKGYWLMYYASFSPEKDVRSSAVRYGIGRHRGSDAGNIYKRLLELAMANEHAEVAINKARQGGWHKDLMLEYLQPYLNSPDTKIRQRAVLIEKFFSGEVDYRKWYDDSKIKKAEEKYADKLTKIRNTLLAGNSEQRLEMIGIIAHKDNRLYFLRNKSFIPALEACTKDSNSEVRKQAAIWLRFANRELKKRLEAEGHIVIRKGKSKYFMVKDFEKSLVDVNKIKENG